MNHYEHNGSYKLDVSKFRWPLDRIEMLAEKIAWSYENPNLEDTQFWESCVHQAIKQLDAMRQATRQAVEEWMSEENWMSSTLSEDGEQETTPDMPFVRAIKRITGQVRADRARKYVCEMFETWLRGRHKYPKPILESLPRIPDSQSPEVGARQWINCLRNEPMVPGESISILQTYYARRRELRVKAARQAAAGKRHGSAVKKMS